MDYYGVLGVDSQASQEDVRAAYRQLVKRHHPDVNDSPEANARMSEINVAYTVLSNPSKRTAYDCWLSEETHEGMAEGTYGGGATGSYTHPEYSQAPPQSSEFLTCDRCGTIDETLTAVVFEYIVPLIILVQRRCRVGVFCARCRLQLSVFYTFEVLLLGWLGGLFGIAWSIAAFLKNVRGGAAPADINAAITWNLALLLVRLQAFDKALYAARRSKGYQDTADVNHLICEIEKLAGSSSSTGPRLLQRHPALVNLGIMAAIIFTLSLPALLSGDSYPDYTRPTGNAPAAVYLQPQRGYSGYTERTYDSRAEQAERLASEVESLEGELEWLQSDIDDSAREIEAFEDDIRTGYERPDYRYERMIDEHNRMVDEYNAKLEEYGARIDEHNGIASHWR